MTPPDDDCRRCQVREDRLEAELARREAEIGAAWEALPDDVAGDYSTLADAIRALVDGLNGWEHGS